VSPPETHQPPRPLTAARPRHRRGTNGAHSLESHRPLHLPRKTPRSKQARLPTVAGERAQNGGERVLGNLPEQHHEEIGSAHDFERDQWPGFAFYVAMFLCEAVIQIDREIHARYRSAGKGV